ncbi:conserved protein of unknown function [Pararobbsia alpina]
MTTEKVTSIMSLMVVGCFVFTSSLVVIAPVLTGKPTAEYTEHLKTYWSLYSGIIGLIVGFYFGKRNR